MSLLQFTTHVIYGSHEHVYNQVGPRSVTYVNLPLTALPKHHVWITLQVYLYCQ